VKRALMVVPTPPLELPPGKRVRHLLAKYNRLRHHVYKLDETLVKVLLNSHDQMKTEEGLLMQLDTTNGRIEQAKGILGRASEQLKMCSEGVVCDHEVGICWCSHFHVIEEIDAFLGGRKTWWERMEEEVGVHDAQQG